MEAAGPDHVRRRLGQTAPFAVALLFAFGIAAVGPGRDHLTLLAVAFGLLLVVALALAAMTWKGVSGAIRFVPVFAIFPIVGMIRHAEGVHTSAYAPLLTLPLLWLILYASRAQLVAGLVAGGATIGLPPLVIGPPDYPSTEWSRVAVYAFLAPIACFAIHNLVARVREQASTVERLRGRLALTEESFRAAFVDAPAAQFMCAPTGALLRVNDAMCELAGFDRDDLFGAEIADIFCRAEAERIADALMALWYRDESAPVELQVRVRREDDEQRVAQLRLALVRGGDGRPLFLLGHALDVTARVAEEREKELRDDGARAVRAATRELADSPDARHHICSAVLEVTGATGAALLEADANGALVTTAQIGGTSAAPAVQIGRARSCAATAFASHKPVLAVASDPAVDGPLAGVEWLGAVLFEPVLHDDVAIGVLVAGWAQLPAEVPDGAVIGAHLLAGETGEVLMRSDRLETLTRLAHQDALTGLPNRRVWEEQLPREMTRALREGGPLCVAIIDLDHFKAYNDQYGHQAGDRLLLEAASAWRSRLRGSDILARYGGEEFAVVLPSCDPDRAVGLLERLRQATPGDTTCSVGLAVWDTHESAVELIDRADRALYAAKRAGRNRTIVAQQETTANAA